MKNKQTVYVLIDAKNRIVNPLAVIPGKQFYEKREDANIYKVGNLKVKKAELVI